MCLILPCTCERPVNDSGRRALISSPSGGGQGGGLAPVPAAIGLRVPRPPAPNACLPVWIPLLTAVCRLGKARSDSESAALREAGLDPVGHAGMLPDQRVGGHSQRNRLTLAADLDVHHVRLAGDPPAGIAVHRGFLQGGSRPQALAHKAWVEVATELGDEHP